VTKIIAIGGSAGALEPLLAIVRRLPKTLEAPVLVTEHVGMGRSMLPHVLNKVAAMRAHHAVQGEALEPGSIYVAPPDRHLRVENNRVELSHGPKENWSRPAIDPMFRAAALEFGPDAAGVVLSGTLNDGTAGLYEIKRNGGKTLVQTPRSALHAGMPQSAVQNVEVDYCLSPAEIGDLLVKLVAHEAGNPPKRKVPNGAFTMTKAANQASSPIALSCPECGGAMREDHLGNLTQFRCHIGHIMTAQVLAAQQIEGLEYSLDSAVRALNEREALCREMAERERANGRKTEADVWRSAQAEALARKDTIAKLTDLDWIHPESVAESSGGETG
jgi:two-component system chemotaxis response regulator CheB